tara:strand:+ start:825 stop:1553 length:729 start_codon:yes stop_codon:yes gene_type:complete
VKEQNVLAFPNLIYLFKFNESCVSTPEPKFLLRGSDGGKMDQPNYCVVTLAKCKAVFMPEALELTQGFKKEIEEKANPISIRYGVLSTGQHAGAIAFFQNYLSLEHFEKSFEIYQEAQDYRTLFESAHAHIISRNIVKYSPIQFDENLTASPKYLVLTRIDTADSMAEQITGLSPLFSEAGALTYRLGTIITGTNVGNQILGVTYSTMESIEKVYSFLDTHPDYKALLAKVTVNMRDIVKLQ